MKKLFANIKQQAMLAATAVILLWIGGRGSGKSAAVAFYIYRCASTMPKSHGVMVGATYQHLEDKEMRTIIDIFTNTICLEQYTKENGNINAHFCYGIKPPSHWPKPYSTPTNYARVLSFCNGSCLSLGSLFHHESLRGASYDYGILQEAATCPEHTFNKVAYPIVRGLRHKYKSNRYLTWLLISNMPWTASGMWLLSIEKLALKKERNKYGKPLYQYMESTIWDMVDFYGEENILAQRDFCNSQNPDIWDIEYENKRPNLIPNGFYPYFDDNIHLYNSDEYNYYDLYQPLEISLDFNEKFNTMSVWQDIETKNLGRVLSCQNALYVKGNQTIEHIVSLFCKIYKCHYNRRVYVYGDANGNILRGQQTLTIFQRIMDLLAQRGFEPELMTTGVTNPEHYIKFNNINEMFEGNFGLTLKFDTTHAQLMVQSLKGAPLTKNFRKDKEIEKKTNAAPGERTDLSDTADYYLNNKYEQITENSNIPKMVL